MKRLHADLLLGFAGLIWGFGFVAQKDAASSLGPFTFVACRFLISAIFVLPLALREKGFSALQSAATIQDKLKVIALCLVFSAAVTIQQYGITTTTVTNAAFLTGTYIVLVPFAALILYRQKLFISTIVASCLSLFGVWLLSGTDVHNLTSGLHHGDWFILMCALCFALQVAMMGHVVGIAGKPFTLSFLQYIVTGLIALMLAISFEHIDLHSILAAWLPIVFAGVLSGGVAYTLQAVAQQHTPAADSAIILSTESLFGAIGGAWLLHETMNMSGYLGCAAIMTSILLVELLPVLRKKTP